MRIGVVLLCAAWLASATRAEAQNYCAWLLEGGNRPVVGTPIFGSELISDFAAKNFFDVSEVRSILEHVTLPPFVSVAVKSDLPMVVTQNLHGREVQAVFKQWSRKPMLRELKVFPKALMKDVEVDFRPRVLRVLEEVPSVDLGQLSLAFKNVSNIYAPFYYFAQLPSQEGLLNVWALFELGQTVIADEKVKLQVNKMHLIRPYRSVGYPGLKSELTEIFAKWNGLALKDESNWSSHRFWLVARLASGEFYEVVFVKSELDGPLPLVVFARQVREKVYRRFLQTAPL